MKHKFLLNNQAHKNLALILTAAANSGRYPNLWIDTAKSILLKGIRYQDTIYIVKIKNMDSARIMVEVDTHIDDAIEDYLRLFIGKILQLDLNLELFYQELIINRHDQRLIDDFHGMTILQDDNILESLVKAIISQQVSMKAARTFLLRFMKLCYEAKPTEFKDIIVYTMPEGQILQENIEKNINNLEFLSKRKIEYLLTLLRWWNSLTAHHQVSVDDLIALRGIGPWTAQYGLIFGEGKQHYFLNSDIGLHRCIEVFYGLAHREINTKNIDAYAQKYTWKSYYMYYLWEYGFKYGLWQS